MSLLEKKKLELQLSKCRTAKLEIEFKIAEKQEEIERCKEHITLQEKREMELLEQINKEQ